MSMMQFWGVEVNGKEPHKVHVEDGSIVHISQATLGEVKKDKEPVMLSVKFGDKKLVLGVLSSDKTPQLSFDLVFEKDFEISHNWKNGSIHLMGYQSEVQEDYSSFSSEEDEEMPLALPMKMNGAPKAIKDNKVKVEEDEDDSDDDEDDSGSDSEVPDNVSTDGTSVDGSDDDEEDSDDDDESDDEEDDSEEEETPKPVPASSGKKRPNKPEVKTPESKKAKLATPQKTDGKKGAPHTATPHPNKKGGKTPIAEKSPASGGKIACGSCTKGFNSEKALDSHKKAKHGGK